MREPGELIAEQSKTYLREKNAEIFDALIAQERITEKYKWELKKTGESLEQESKKVDTLRRDNNKLRLILQAASEKSSQPK